MNNNSATLVKNTARLWVAIIANLITQQNASVMNNDKLSNDFPL